MRALYKLFVLFLCMYVVDTVGKNCEFFMKKFSETLTFLRQSVANYRICTNKRPFSILIMSIFCYCQNMIQIFLPFFVIIHNFSWSTCQYFVSRNLIHTSSGGTYYLSLHFYFNFLPSVVVFSTIGLQLADFLTY